CPNANRLLTSLRFTSDQEAALMQPIMERKAPEQVARDWIKANPQVVDAWLVGVTTLDGKPANAALVAGN
ncbi:MAG: glycine/betaine ABC transporter substrate-binding protein, partial [Pseudomonadales bacterium]